MPFSHILAQDTAVRTLTRALETNRVHHAYRFEGQRYDCGSAEGFVIANVAMALERDDVGAAVREFLSKRV